MNWDRAEKWDGTPERRLLACMLLSDDVADAAIARMKLEHFISPAHKLLFAALAEQRAKGLSVDIMAMIERLKGLGRLQDCGGEYYLLTACEDVPHADLWRTYAAIVLDRWAEDQTILTGQQVDRGEINADEMRMRLEAILQGVASTTPPRSGRLSKFAGRGKKTGVPTGFGLIDRATTCKGLPDGQMSVVMASTGGGKTAWSVQVAYNVASLGKRVCYATFADMDAHDIADRMTKNICGLSGEPIKGTPQHAEWCEAVKALDALDIEVYDATDMRKGRDVETFAEWFRGMNAKKRFDLLIVDYAQELTSREPKAKSMLEQAEAVAHVLRWLAAETTVPSLVGSQMTEGNVKAGTQDITKGSRVWQERAAIVLKLTILSEEERAKQKDGMGMLQGLTRAELLKNRFGKRGQWVWWQWMGSHARFEERS